ncbi:MAG: phosphoheptose isomerase, partial [Flavobacterium stagni]
MKAEDIEKSLQSITENGQHLSPILPEGIKNYLIDIDGTICDDIPNEEPERMLTA